MVAGTTATGTASASARAPFVDPFPPMTSRPLRPSASMASRHARRPSGSRSCGQRLVPSHVPGSCMWSRACSDVIGSASPADEAGEPGVDAQGAAAEPLDLLAGAGDDGVHARSVAAAGEYAEVQAVIRFRSTRYIAPIRARQELIACNRKRRLVRLRRDGPRASHDRSRSRRHEADGRDRRSRRARVLAPALARAGARLRPGAGRDRRSGRRSCDARPSTTATPSSRSAWRSPPS